MLRSGERKQVQLARQAAWHVFLHQLLLRAKTTLREFTAVQSLTLIDVYEEDALSNIDVQIWKVDK